MELKPLNGDQKADEPGFADSAAGADATTVVVLDGKQKRCHVSLSLSLSR